jgi:2-dehydro-3-deoxyphosphogalactonate aldolase
LLVTPNTNPAVIARGVKRGLTVMPGFYTPSEGFAAVAAGARYLKLFPASRGGSSSEGHAGGLPKRQCRSMPWAA